MRFYRWILRLTYILLAVLVWYVILDKSDGIILNKELMLYIIALLYPLSGALIHKMMVKGNFKKILLPNSKKNPIQLSLISIAIGYNVLHWIFFRNMNFDWKLFLLFMSVMVLIHAIISLRKKILLSSSWIFLPSGSFIRWIKVKHFSLKLGVLEIWNASSRLRLDFKQLSQADTKVILQYVNTHMQKILNGQLDYVNGELTLKDNLA